MSTHKRRRSDNMTSQVNAIDHDTSRLSLQSFISNAFYGVFIQDDDDVALQVYNKHWSKHVQEVDNGKPLNFASFRELLLATRRTITDRYLLSQSFVSDAKDPFDKAAQVAHTSHWTGIQDGKSIKGTIVSVLKIALLDGRRKIETESFVLSVENA